MKIVSPKIKNCVEYSIIDSIKDNDYSNKLYKTNIKENIIISDITFDSCIFNNINFSNIKLDNVDLIDVIFKDCDIYVQPSRHEGYCITLAEAKCFGKPIVTTNFTGAKEQIVKRDTGIIVECNSEDLYKALKEVIDNVELRNRISKNVTKTLADTSSEINKFLKL